MTGFFSRFRRDRERSVISIYDHVRAHIPAQGQGLTDGGERLPDDAEIDEPIRWMAGAKDGVAVHHMGIARPADGDVREIVFLIGEAAAGGERQYRELETRLRSVEAIDVVDAVLQGVAAEGMPRDRLARVARLAEVLSLAERSLPLSEIGTGAASEYGLGERFRAHSALEFVVQGLKRFPGRGWPLISVALRSPVIRSRNMVLNALEAWGREAWPPEVEQALRAAREVEPDDGVRGRLDRLTSSHHSH